MSKYGFLDVLEEEMDKVFPFDFEINWDKKNHAPYPGTLSPGQHHAH